MEELKYVPDRYLLDLADRTVILWQRVTGIPKWRVEVNLWCLMALLCLPPVARKLGHGIGYGSFVMVAVVSALQVLMWGLTGPLMRRPQDVADSSNAPVPCLLRTNRWGSALGLALRVWFLYSAGATLYWGSMHLDNVVHAILLIVAAYLSSVHTWPNNGPTLRDRWRNLQAKFTSSRLVPCPVKSGD